MKKIKKSKTYIEGFDKLIEGGFNYGSSVLISGTPGTGKTIFSLEYLYNGASKESEVGIYFSFKEKRKSLVEQAKQFNFDIEKFEKKQLLKLISIGSNDISENTVRDIIEIIESTKAKRVL